MNVLEAIEQAKAGKVVWRRSWEDDRGMIWRKGQLYLEAPGGRVRKVGLFLVDSVMATDWVAE